MAKSGSTYFQKYLKVAPFSHALWRSIEAQELSKYRLKRPVLDIGCGFGEFAGIFFPSSVEVGIDIDSKELLKAAETGKYNKTIIADARNLPFKNNSFSTVISISTLEHIQGNHKVFKETYRILKPGGLFIITVPTDRLFDALLVVKILTFLGLKGLSYVYFKALNKAFKHVFLPSETKWVELASRAGFKIEKVSGTISQKALIFWELGLPFAIPSQLSKLFLGRRLTVGSNIKTKIFKPFTRLIKSDPNFKANLIIVSRKPK